ncbi:MAG: ABC transporter permease [Alphaproteobacteria bacterium]|nr:ABC transporter permease [Alphaproteobacteria bacterium]
MTVIHPTDPILPVAPSRLRNFLTAVQRFFRRAPLSAFWGCVAAAIVVMSVAAPVIAPYPPLKSDFRAMQKPPSEKHWFGTDQIGRDTLSRVIYGSQASLTVAFGAVLFGTTLGALWGLACGYFGGRFDMFSQRLIEFLQSFPDLILAMAIAMALGASLGFLGVGIPPPNPTWGNMLSDALNAGLVPPWWLVLFPGLAITVTVLAFNLLGDGIRDMLDPRLRGSV